MTTPVFYNLLDKLFISGIDTDAGKSYVTGWLASEMMKQGMSVITQKFVQTGNADFSEDIDVHRRIMGIGMQEVDLAHITAPVIYSYPASPELAARIDGRALDLNIITEATEKLRGLYDHVLIEGAGGLMVPLKGEYLTIDYIHERHLPLVLVTNSKLGSINHTLLALNAVKSYHIDLYAVVYNHHFDMDKPIAEDTRIYVQKWLEHHFPKTILLDME